MRLVLCDDNRISCEALAVALEARGHRGAARAIRDQCPDTALLMVPGRSAQAATLAVPSPGSDPGPQQARDPLSTLTPRETEVLRRIAAGHNTKKMAREMNVTTETLRTYVKKVLGKLGAHSRLEAAALASRQIPPGQDDGDHPLLAALTPREREVLMHFTKGYGLREWPNNCTCP